MAAYDGRPPLRRLYIDDRIPKYGEWSISHLDFCGKPRGDLVQGHFKGAGSRVVTNPGLPATWQRCEGLPWLEMGCFYSFSWPPESGTVLCRRGTAGAERKRSHPGGGR